MHGPEQNKEKLCTAKPQLFTERCAALSDEHHLLNINYTNVILHRSLLSFWVFCYSFHSSIGLLSILRCAGPLMDRPEKSFSKRLSRWMSLRSQTEKEAKCERWWVGHVQTNRRWQDDEKELPTEIARHISWVSCEALITRFDCILNRTRIRLTNIVRYSV